MQVKRLQEELDRKAQELTDISKRIEQAEQRLNARAKVGSSVDAQAKLAERINRLETENRTLTEENRRLRSRSGNTKAVAVDEQNRPEES
jgi:regulator of replication initiation timing